MSLRSISPACNPHLPPPPHPPLAAAFNTATPSPTSGFLSSRHLTVTECPFEQAQHSGVRPDRIKNSQNYFSGRMLKCCIIFEDIPKVSRTQREKKNTDPNPSSPRTVSCHPSSIPVGIPTTSPRAGSLFASSNVATCVVCPEAAPQCRADQPLWSRVVTSALCSNSNFKIAYNPKNSRVDFCFQISIQKNLVSGSRGIHER